MTTAEMGQESKKRFLEWLRILRNEYETNLDMSQSEYLLALWEVEKWYSWDGARIDRIYMQQTGTR